MIVLILATINIFQGGGGRHVPPLPLAPHPVNEHQCVHTCQLSVSSAEYPICHGDTVCAATRGEGGVGWIVRGEIFLKFENENRAGRCGDIVKTPGIHTYMYFSHYTGNAYKTQTYYRSTRGFDTHTHTITRSLGSRTRQTRA